ncbi:stage II sporulation protein M [Kordiimonas lipolytica]|uniref:Stage II sporulation protein M n=1 Tax=Kordiimonas lipolytica TaxID=1662421 RepID=A0ABV8U693_9PROT|nr:stage II sporulation protein M [Kordiimonas lipolytica]
MALEGTKSFQFRQEREAGWQQLEKLVMQAEKKGIRSLSAADVFELPHLYKGALSSLSVARSISLDKNVVDYLENLTTRAYFLLYGHQRPAGKAFARLMQFSVPDAVRSLKQEFIVAFVVMFLGVMAGFFLVLQNPDWFFTFMNRELADGRVPRASAEELKAVIYPAEDKLNSLDIFATQLFTHNSQVGLLAFALGFALGLPTIWLLFQNGTMLGAFLALHYEKDLLYELGGWLIIHGSTEILAIILCGAAGLAIARHYVFPGKLSRMESLAIYGKKAALVAFGCILMFLVAGLLEGFARQLVSSDTGRYTIGLGFLFIWALYFLGVGRNAPEDASDDIGGKAS